MKYNDSLMNYISNNAQNIFKEDIRLFHSGFPSMMKRNDIIDINLDFEANNDHDDFDLNEVLMDY